MKFIPVATAAKRLKVGEQVFTLNEDGEYGVGKLTERSENSSGLVVKFEVPQYTSADAPPSLKPTIVTNITHVCNLKNRKLKPDEDANQE